jgi:hypothetical protein
MRERKRVRQAGEREYTQPGYRNGKCDDGSAFAAGHKPWLRCAGIVRSASPVEPHVLLKRHQGSLKRHQGTVAAARLCVVVRQHSMVPIVSAPGTGVRTRVRTRVHVY